LSLSAISLSCFFILFVSPTRAQLTRVDPVHLAAGTVLTFHLQTRLHPVQGNAMDLLPTGTVLRVTLLDSIDSATERDGAEFRGVLVSALVSGQETIVRLDSEVRVLLALLRSKNHPDGFRYELLATSVKDHGKSLDLTASMNPVFLDNTPQ
jgi:hypothetical protein